MHSSPSPSRLARKCRSSKQVSEPSSTDGSTAPQTVTRDARRRRPASASAAMLARCVTRLESRRWPSPWRETCSTSAPANVPARDQRLAPVGGDRLGPGGFEPRQRVGARARDDPDRHGAGVSHKLPAHGAGAGHGRTRSPSSPTRVGRRSTRTRATRDVEPLRSASSRPERTLAIRDGEPDRRRHRRSTRAGSTVPGGRGAGRPASRRSASGRRHRRRGLLSALMRRQLDDVHEAGREAVAALWASEPVIYGRFGYGLGDARRRPRRRQRQRAPALGARRPGRPAHARRGARPPCARSTTALRPTMPGMLDREGPWWDDRIEDPEERPRGQQRRCAPP